MEFKIKDKKKKDMFISIFSLLKNASSLIHLTVTPTTFHIQGMDKSHVCLFDLSLCAEWFYYYEVEGEHLLCFDTVVFYSIISIKSEDQTLVFHLLEDKTDVLGIEVCNEDREKDKKGDYNKYFSLPLIDYDYEQMCVPITEYDAEMSLPSKKMADMLVQLANFGQDLVIQCTDQYVDFIANGDNASMRVNIPFDELNSYSIVEGEEIKLSYNLMYISKMCITNKLTDDVELYLSNECPMKIVYHLGENSLLTIFIAPKVTD